MLEIRFSLAPIDDDLSEFELGDIEIKIENQIISSKNKSPNQSMMIFISISELLSGTTRMINSKEQEYRFVGVGSSFTFLLRKKKTKKRAYLIYRKHKYEVSLIEFAIELQRSVKDFLDINKWVFDRNEGVINDLCTALDTLSELC